MYRTATSVLMLSGNSADVQGVRPTFRVDGPSEEVEMIEIRCRCSSCAEISSAALDELLLVLPDTPDDPGPRIVHGCDHCGATSIRDIDERLAGLLLTHGI